ncbi:unnamed protein product [Prunus armeniaca]
MATSASGSSFSFVAYMPNVSNVLTIKLELNTYPLWLVQIVPRLCSRSLMMFVDGTSTCPLAFHSDVAGKPTDKVNLAYEDWIQQDQMVLSWINGSLSPDVLATVARSTSAHLTWLSLEKRYAFQNQNRLLQLRGDLPQTTQGVLSIADFLDKVNSLADNLALFGSSVSDSNLVAIIMNNMGPLYETTVSSAQVCDSHITYDTPLKTLILSAERRLQSV